MIHSHPLPLQSGPGAEYLTQMENVLEMVNEDIQVWNPKHSPKKFVEVGSTRTLGL
jgi:hypothetical protein